MPKPRGREHTTLTETAQIVVRELEKLPGINPDPYFRAASDVDANKPQKNVPKNSNAKSDGLSQQQKRHESKGGIKMIAPGEIKVIKNTRSGKKFITATYTNAGMELLISGQSVQKIAVHTDNPELVFAQLKDAKSLRDFAFKSRERKPGV